MDKFVIEGEKLNVENVSEGTHTNKNSRSISSEGECWTFCINFRFAPPLTWRCSGKKKHSHHAAIILNCRNVAKHLWREPQIIKLESAFHIWINIGYICERTFSAMWRIKIQIATYNCNLIVLCYSFRAKFHKIGQLPTASGVLLMVSRIIYLFIYLFQ